MPTFHSLDSLFIVYFAVQSLRLGTCTLLYRERSAGKNWRGFTGQPNRLENIQMPEYRRNHYVPIWYQHRFLPDINGERKFYYLDLKPECRLSGERSYERKALHRWGPARCFQAVDLYTTKYGAWESTDIEKHFFGRIDSSARFAIDYFASFQHPSANEDAFRTLIRFMSIQKMRTPKGLAALSHLANLRDKNLVLFKLQEIQEQYCALWTECVWSIADASDSDTKFILSDHPVTVYNKGCFPGSSWCRDFKDPEISLTGTHTFFPLSLDKLLILTNLSWARNPYDNPQTSRPNPSLFRTAVFNFHQIQIGRVLSDLEVAEINYVIKRRAYRYIAASNREWLYPEEKMLTNWWDQLGKGYLLMPDPRSVTFSSEIVFGRPNNTYDWYDAYGRKPWQSDYNDKSHHDLEWATLHAFQGEFARIFGPRRRGRTYEFGRISPAEDTLDHHAQDLRLEQEYKQKLPSKYRKKTRKNR